jgi:hypothetical protein
MLAFRICSLALLVLAVGCGAGGAESSASSPDKAGEAATSCAPYPDNRDDRPALVVADTETACEHSHGGGTARLSLVSFLTHTWTSLSIEAQEERGLCARADIERRMKKRCADYAESMCCPHPAAAPASSKR